MPLPMKYTHTTTTDARRPARKSAETAQQMGTSHNPRHDDGHAAQVDSGGVGA
jgi:hypothetical protein